MTSITHRSRFALGLTLASLGSALAATACGAEGPTPGDGGGEDLENTGSIGIDLDVGPGVSVNTVTYDVSGNGFHKTGSANVSHSHTLHITIGSIPAGNNFILTLHGNDATDPRIECLGTTTFNVTAGQTTTARLPFSCILPRGRGTVDVTADGNICPRIDGVSAEPSETTVGNTLALSSSITDDSVPSAATYSWRASSGTLANAGTANPTFTCTAAGSVTITLDVTDTVCTDSVSTTVTCSTDGTPPPPPPPPNLKVNEVESNQGVPGDWTEIYNAGTTPVNLTGFVFKDNDDTHIYTIPSGTIAPGGYFIVEEAAQGFGLGAADSARLFDPSGVLVDSFSWTAHAATTYGRCPNGSGSFVTTVASSKGAQNECPGVVITMAWPGANNVQTVDGSNVFQTNLSGLTYQAASGGSPAVLWAVRNGPGTLFRLIQSGGIWTPDPANGFGAGKPLRYVDGTGNPDSEGITFAEAGSTFAYVSTERNNDANTISRPAVLRVDTASTDAAAVATHDWNLTSDLPVVGANLGLEAITWIPDTFLVAGSFFDESASHIYAPAEYPNHGTGLFFVGLEANGSIYAYALDHVGGGFHRIATILSGHPGMMGIEFDRELGNLWAACDNTCQGQMTVLRLDTVASSPTFGRFIIRRKIERPGTMPNLNNEGIAFVPLAECVSGQRAFFWTDDGETDGHSIRQDSIPCASFF